MCTTEKVGSDGILVGRHLPEAFLFWTVVTGTIQLFRPPVPPNFLYPFRKRMVAGPTVDSKLTTAVVPVSFTLKPTTATLPVVVPGTEPPSFRTGMPKRLVNSLIHPAKPASRTHPLKLLSPCLAQCGN